MNCPNCGNEIEESQNFCPNCGAKLNDDNKTLTTDTEFKTTNNNKIVKICLITLVSLLILLGGYLGYKANMQYQKDIAPLEVITPFEYCSKCKLNASYVNKNIILTLTTDKIIENWQKDYYNQQTNNKITLTINQENYQQKFDFSNISLTVGSPLSIEFRVQNAKVSDFVKLKEALNNKEVQYSLVMPTMFGFNPKNIKIAKKDYDLWVKEKKEQERLEKIRNEILSNCVYKTNSGTCFTTKMFKAPVIPYEDCMAVKSLYGIKECSGLIEEGSFVGQTRYDQYAGATIVCKNLGYKLPENADLTSLASDIFGGINVYNGLNSTTYYDNSIGINDNPFKLLNIKYNEFTLFENGEYNTKEAYARRLSNDIMGYNTSRVKIDRWGWYREQEVDVICVYDPNGNPDNSLAKTASERIRIAREKLKQQKEEERINQD